MVAISPDFGGAFMFDVVPFPFPPEFTIMVFLQIMFKLNIWLVIVIGVAGSILGRYILTLYIPHLAERFLNIPGLKMLNFWGER